MTDLLLSEEKDPVRVRVFTCCNDSQATPLARRNPTLRLAGRAKLPETLQPFHRRPDDFAEIWIAANFCAVRSRRIDLGEVSTRRSLPGRT